MMVITYQIIGSEGKHVSWFTDHDAALAQVLDLMDRRDVKVISVQDEAHIEKPKAKTQELLEAYPDALNMTQQELLDALADEIADVKKLEGCGKVYQHLTLGRVTDPRASVSEVLETIRSLTLIKGK